MSTDLPQTNSPETPNKLVIAVDSQILSKIQTCNQQAAYRHLDNIEPVDYDEESLQIGLVMHEGLAEYYVNKHRLALSELKVRSIGRMEAYALAKTQIKRTDLNTLIDVFGQYVNKYYAESWKVKFDDNNDPLVERTFAKTLYEDDEIHVLYTGVTDLVVDNEAIVTPVDHKTFGGWFAGNYNSNQFHGYMWALNSKNLIVNRVGVKKQAGKFERVVVHRNNEQLEEWKRDAIDDILNHLGQMHRGYFRRNREACTMYGGCRYLKLCMAQPAHRPYLIKNEYKQVPEWSPLNRD